MLKCDHSNESYRAELPYFDWCYPVQRPLFCLQSPSSARNKKQIRGVGVGEEENRRYIFFILAFRACSRALTDLFERTERKIKKVCVETRSMFKAILTSESHNKILWCNHSNKTSWTILLHHAINFQVAVVQKVDNVIHRINLYPVNSAIGFPNTCPLDSDLSCPGCSNVG